MSRPGDGPSQGWGGESPGAHGPREEAQAEGLCEVRPRAQQRPGQEEECRAALPSAAAGPRGKPPRAPGPALPLGLRCSSSSLSYTFSSTRRDCRSSSFWDSSCCLSWASSRALEGDVNCDAWAGTLTPLHPQSVDKTDEGGRTCRHGQAAPGPVGVSLPHVVLHPRGRGHEDTKLTRSRLSPGCGTQEGPATHNGKTAHWPGLGGRRGRWHRGTMETCGAGQELRPGDPGRSRPLCRASLQPPRTARPREDSGPAGWGAQPPPWPLPSGPRPPCPAPHSPRTPRPQGAPGSLHCLQAATPGSTAFTGRPDLPADTSIGPSLSRPQGPEPTCSARCGCCRPPGAAAACASPARGPRSAASRCPPSRTRTLAEGARGSQPSWRGTLVTFRSPSVYLQTRTAPRRRDPVCFLQPYYASTAPQLKRSRIRNRTRFKLAFMSLAFQLSYALWADKSVNIKAAD